MILYCYDESGVLTGPVSPALSPSRPFVGGKPNYLRPARSTDKIPPAAEPGKKAVFDGERWSLVEDHRGRTVYSTATGEPRVLDALGPVPPGCVPSPPPSREHIWDGGDWREDETLLLKAVRRERNARLTASDWTQLADVPLTSPMKAAWAGYRQALRDYPEGWTKGKPWPAEPKE